MAKTELGIRKRGDLWDTQQPGLPVVVGGLESGVVLSGITNEIGKRGVGVDDGIGLLRLEETDAHQQDEQFGFERLHEFKGSDLWEQTGNSRIPGVIAGQAWPTLRMGTAVL